MSTHRHLLVLGHARAQGLGHHLLERVRAILERAGHEVRVHDLANDGFDPVLRLAPDEEHARPCAAAQDPLCHRYQQDVLWADRLTVLHPVYWFAPPAILKGWVDRVLVDGVALEFRADGPPRGRLRGVRALVVQTFDAPRVADRVATRGVAARFWKHAVFAPLGVEKVVRLALYGVDHATPERIERFARALERRALTL